MIAKRPAIWIGLICAAGLIMGYAWPPPPITRAAIDAAAWSMPSATRLARYSPELFAKVSRELRWGTAAATGDGTFVNWRLAGFFVSDEPAVLVMDLQSGKSKRVAIGQQLPDGSTLHVMDGDTITTGLDKCERTYQLYQLQPTKSSSGCATEVSPDESAKELSK